MELVFNPTRTAFRVYRAGSELLGIALGAHYRLLDKFSRGLEEVITKP